MQPTRKFILAFACISFLTISLSGFHLHADIGEHEESAPHAHDHYPVLAYGPEHVEEHLEEHVDISVFEPARGFSKVEMLALAIVVPEYVARPSAEVCWSKDAPNLVPKRFSWTRQPHRGPPISV